MPINCAWRTPSQTYTPESQQTGQKYQSKSNGKQPKTKGVEHFDVGHFREAFRNIEY
jgi:hypothetical protein